MRITITLLANHSPAMQLLMKSFANISFYCFKGYMIKGKVILRYPIDKIKFVYT